MTACTLMLIIPGALHAQPEEPLRLAIAAFEENWYARRYAEAEYHLGRIYALDTAEVFRYAEEAEFLYMTRYASSAGQQIRPGAADTLSAIFHSAILHDREKRSEWIVKRALLLLRHPSVPRGGAADTEAALRLAFMEAGTRCPLFLAEEYFDRRLRAFRQNHSSLRGLMMEWQAVDRLLAQRPILVPEDAQECASLMTRFTRELRLAVPDCAKLHALAHRQLRESRDSITTRTFYLLNLLHNCADSVFTDSLEQAVLGSNSDPYWYRLAAQRALNREQYDAALKLSTRAIELEKDPLIRAGDFLFMGYVHAGHRIFRFASEDAEKAIALHPNWGEPYLFMADCYVKGRDACKMSAFDQKAVCWGAIDLCMIARNVDASVEAAANQRIIDLQKQMPSREECAGRGLRPGDTYPLRCWIDVTTTVKYE